MKNNGNKFNFNLQINNFITASCMRSWVARRPLTLTHQREILSTRSGDVDFVDAVNNNNHSMWTINDNIHTGSRSKDRQ